MMRKYKLDTTGKNFRLGSPEHLRHQKVEQAKMIAESALGMLSIGAMLYGLSWVGYLFDLQ